MKENFHTGGMALAVLGRAAATMAVAVTGLCGCAWPHRKAVTQHTVEVFEHRTDGLISRQRWEDAEGGGGFFLFADPSVQAMSATHTNQWALGGGSAFGAGSMTTMVDSNLAPAIAAGGTAAGNAIGAAIKK